MASVAVVPAAGAGERFGGAKLLALIRSEPLLSHTIQSLLGGGVDRVVVVLPPSGSFDAVRALADPRVCTVVNPDPSRGMFSSIQVGVASAEGDPSLVLPGDMPFVRPETVASVLAACQRTNRIVSPRYAGRRGHPVGLPGYLRREIVDADPAVSLSAVLEPHERDRIDLDVQDGGVLRDVDVIGDLFAATIDH
jgi:molybdenum cofactor cytidylyltransferase